MRGAAHPAMCKGSVIFSFGNKEEDGFKMFTLRMIPATGIANVRNFQSLKNAETTFSDFNRIW